MGNRSGIAGYALRSGRVSDAVVGGKAAAAAYDTAYYDEEEDRRRQQRDFLANTLALLGFHSANASTLETSHGTLEARHS